MNRFVYLMDKYGNPYSFSLKPKYYKTLVLSGGAMRGVYLLGALNGLKIKINKISTFIGISSGSIICFLLSIGYTPYEIFISLLNMIIS